MGHFTRVVRWSLGRRWIFPSPRFKQGPAQRVSAAVLPAAQRLFARLFSLVFPENCAVCDAPLANVSRVPVCEGCLASPQPLAAEYYCLSCHAPFMNRYPLDENGRCILCRRGLNGFDAAYAFGSYEGTLKKLIQLLKYGGITTLSQPLGALLAAAVPRERAFDVVVPMPMHWRRRFSRGFNQSELLARVFAKRFNLKTANAVRKSKATPPQAGLTGAQRRRNVTGTFAVPKPELVRGKRVLLVDDVLTTGATAAACARALKRAGAGWVAVVTVARADRRFADVSGIRVSRFETPPFGGVLDAQSGSTA
jgi:ComF family protein